MKEKFSSACFVKNLLMLRLGRLKRHVESVHYRNSNKYKCHLCDKGFREMRLLESHTRNYHKIELTHTKNTIVPKKIVCELCNNYYSTEKLLVIHMKLVHETVLDERFKCHKCSKKFRFCNELRKHVDYTHNRTRIKCDLCEKSFRPDSLTTHKRNYHENRQEKQKCTECNKEFVDLKKHFKQVHAIRSENDVKEKKPNPVACHICNKVLSTKYVANFHIKNVHQKAFAKKCDLCDKKLSRRDKICHECVNGFTCINVKFATKDSFVRHAANFHK